MVGIAAGLRGRRATGKQAGEAPLPDFIARDPNDTMQLGADTGSRVIEGPPLPQFVGRIESVRIYSGEAP